MKELYQKVENELYKSISQMYSYNESEFTINGDVKIFSIGYKKVMLSISFLFLISNMMIKRVVSESLMTDLEKTFQFESFRKVQATNNQLSTAFMTAGETEAFIDTLSELR